MNLPPMPSFPEPDGETPDYWRGRNEGLAYAEQYGRLCTEASTAELDRLQARVAELEVDAERYRHMRASAVFQDRNGPGLYWYLPRWDRGLPVGERLDAAIDTARKAKP